MKKSRTSLEAKVDKLNAVLAEQYTINDGAIYLTKESTKGASTSQMIAYKPIWPEALIRGNSGEDSWGVKIGYFNFDDVQRLITLSLMDMYNERNGLVSVLAGKGVPIVPRQGQAVFRYLLDHINGLPRETSINHLGWLDKKMEFMMPEGVICSTEPDEKVVYQPKDPAFSNVFEQRGTLESWQQQVLVPIAEQSYSLFALLVAFGSCMLKPLKMESGGFNLWGSSSRGKTAALQGYASVWGNGGTSGTGAKNTFLKSWNATARGIETLPPAYSGIGLALDELGLADDRTFPSVVYMLAEGVGATVMDTSRNAIKPQEWTLLFLSSAEMTMKEKVYASGKSLKQGMEVRLIDVPLDGFEHDDSEESQLSQKQRVENIKQACGEHYGHAGRLFIEGLVMNFDSQQDLAKELLPQLKTIASKYYTEQMSVAQRRISDRFALIELVGLIAIELEILNIEEELVTESVNQAHSAWLNAEETLTEEERGINNVKAYINKHLYRFCPTNELIEANQDNVGFKKDNLYLLSTEQFDIACNGINPTIVKRALSNKNLLHSQASKQDVRYKSRFFIASANKRLPFYAIKSEVLVGDSNEKPSYFANSDDERLQDEEIEAD